DVLERKRLSEVQGIPDPVDVCDGGMHNLVLTKGQVRCCVPIPTFHFDATYATLI
ncbi:hypothetical protein KR067_005976, partial [Drosophila pandora]